MNKSGKSQWVRTVTVEDPQQHPQHNYTVYKVTLRIVPVSTDEDEVEVVIYKRYSDFKKLYNFLSVYHKKLQRREPFPDLVKANFFDRLESKVVEERRASAEEVINFCCQHVHLYTHEVFKVFFDAGIKRTVHLPSVTTPPPQLHSQLSSSYSEPGTPSPQGGTSVIIHNSAHAATSQYREPPTSITEALIEPLVPSRPTPTPLPVTILPPAPLLATHDGDFQPSSDDDDEDEISKKFEDISIFDPYSSGAHTAGSQWLGSGDSAPSITSTRKMLELDPVMQDPSGPSYIQQAGAHITLAANFESSQRWSEAFASYKTAVSLLLSGVQSDQDPARREMVRSKTALYLEHAETIFIEELGDTGREGFDGVVGEEERQDRWADFYSSTVHIQIPDNTVALSLDPELASLYTPRNHLNNYKVLGTLGRVLLVYEKSTNANYVIKSIRKSPSYTTPPLATVVPLHVPFMVRLYRIIETKDCIFLVLEHATGGHLFDWLRQFSVRRNSSSDNFGISGEGFEVGELLNGDASRVYEGRYLLPRTGSDTITHSVSTPKIVDQSSSSSESLTTTASHAQSYIELLTQGATTSTRLQDSWSEEEDISGGVGGEGTQSNEESLNPNLTGDSETFRQVLQEAGKTCPMSQFSIVSVTSDDKEEDEAPSPIAPLSPSSVFEDTMSSTRGSFSARHSQRKFSRQVSLTSQSSGRRLKSRTNASIDGETRSLDRDDRCRLASVSHRHNSGCTNQEPIGAHIDSSSSNQVPENCIRQWAAELVVAIGALHHRGLVIRDLHHENILLGPGGHLRLTFLSQWRQSPPNPTWHRHRKFHNSRLYLIAPELRFSADSSFRDSDSTACDWWSLGVILYEMLTSYPLIAVLPQGLTSHTRLSFPDWLSTEAQDLLTKLLMVNPTERLGSTTLDVDEVKLHPYFSNIDWALLESPP